MISLPFSPSKNIDGTYSPSKLSLKLTSKSSPKYSHINYDKLSNKIKIMIICTEEDHFKMKNNKVFLTGNHPIELLLPILHFDRATFDIDIFTPTGKESKIEMWAFPKDDENILAIFQKYKSKFEQPKSLRKFVQDDEKVQELYQAIFIPGGHGAMLGLPFNNDLKEIILESHLHDLKILSICHGPASFLSLANGDEGSNFIFKGYKMAIFPDWVDKLTPFIGYLPGHISWSFGKHLKDLGVKVVNNKADSTCVIDRNVITGASPLAANKFGIISTKEIIKSQLMKKVIDKI